MATIIKFILVFYGKGQIYSKENIHYWERETICKIIQLKNTFSNKPSLYTYMIILKTHTEKRGLYLSQIPKWHLFRFMINMQKGVPKHVDKIITHKCPEPVPEIPGN